MTIPDPLRTAIEGRTALLVCGLGVSISANRNAPTWRGLIKSGIEEAVRRELGGKATPPKHWSVGALALIEADDVKSWLVAADLFTTKLGGTSDGRYRAWIKSAVGSLRAENTELLEAIAALQCRIATTNYDDLILTLQIWRSMRAIRFSGASRIRSPSSCRTSARASSFFMVTGTTRT